MAASALEQTLVRFGTLGEVPEPFLLRSGKGMVFTGRHFTALVRIYGLHQGFVTPNCGQQNGMVERVIRTLKKQYVHRYRFESLQERLRDISTSAVE